MQCVCCLLKCEDRKKFKKFTSTDGRLYLELTKLQIRLSSKPKICFSCKSELKNSTDFLRRCVQSYAVLITTENEVKIQTKRTRRKVIPILEEEGTPQHCSIDDSGDELPISVLKQQLNKDKELVDIGDAPNVQTKPAVIEEIKLNEDNRKTSKYICIDCGIAFSTSQRLQIHSYTHSGIKNWKCEDCEKVFATKFRLKAHTSNCQLKHESHFYKISFHSQ